MDVNELDESPDKPRPASNVAESNDGTSRHVSKSKSSWGLSTAVHSVGFVAKKVVNNGLTDSLWHSRKGGSSASDEETAKLPVLSNTTDEREKDPSEISKNLDASPNNRGPSAADVSTTGSRDIDPSEDLKPTGNLHVSTTGPNIIDQSESTKRVKPVKYQHRWPSTTASNYVGQSGGIKPRESSHAKLVHQHRWPSRTSSHAVDQSENIKSRDGSHARLVNQHRWPGTVNSNVLSKGIKQPDEAIKLAPNVRKASLPNYASKPALDSSSDATNISSSSSSFVSNNRLKIDDSIQAQPSSPASREVNDTPATRGLSPTPSSGRDNALKVDPPTVSEEADLSNSTKEVDPSLVTRGVTTSLTPRARGASPIPPSRSSSPPHDFHTPMPSSPRELSNLDTVSISTESGHSPNNEIGHTSTAEVSPTDTTRDLSPGSSSDGTTNPTHIATSVRGVSPLPTKGFSHRVRGVIPSLTKPSSTKHFLKSNVFSIFSKITDVRKEKNVSNHIEDSKYLELLHNIQLQWQFANARAEAAFDLRRVTAEKSLFDAWRTILGLRDSIAAKKVDSVLLILQLKLHAILHRQCELMAFIDEWASIRKEYESALSVTTNDLQARSLSVPLIGGVKADIKDLKLVVFSTVQVLQATTSRIQSTLSKLDKTHFLASQLANIALHERALLDECEIFLASTAPLQMEECSLRSYLIQASRTSMNEQ
uniref:AUGMIN subunit 8-like n=1 Tax=Erigeron canadensis TaxID=72917 RepID=UPI001CB93C42|nr:AUGMIN subunit 8-like [Erigeron canadensis]